jgi:inorganic pyrophosphatase
LGVIKADQNEEGRTCRNDRLIGKVAKSHTYRDVETLSALGSTFTNDLALFFETYNRLRGRNFTVMAIGDGARAADLIRQAGA